MAAIKLVGLDLDGTLLNSEHQIPARTLGAVAAARAKGVEVVIVTGRMYQSARKFAEQLGLTDRPIGTYNGAAIWDSPSGRLLFHDPLPLDAAKRLAAFCEARGLHLNAYVDDQLYVQEMNERARSYATIAGVQAQPVGSLFLWVSKPSTKMLIIDEPERILALKPDVEALMGPSFHVTQSTPTFLEITNERGTKGHALAWIAESMGIGRDSVMAMGDAANDLSMLQWAGTSFAMPHSADEVKRGATYVAESGPGLGVAEAFERMGLA